MTIKIAKDMRSSNKRKAAIAYAKAGWCIHPLQWIENGKCSCGNRECDKPGKHPLLFDWINKATKEEKKIKKWWSKWPDANVGGIPPVGVFAIDSDERKGSESYKSLSIETLTARVTTQRGHHRYFWGDLESKISVLPGLDIISGDNKRYLVLPPSVRADGQSYQWGKRDKVARLNGDEFQRIKSLYTKSRILKGSKALTKITEGTRNETLFKLGCSMRRQGFSVEKIQQTLFYINTKYTTEPVGKQEVENIVKSCMRYDAGGDDAYGCMSEVKTESVDWFLYPYFARGAMTIIEGPPGLGKSYFTIFLAAITSTGGKFPLINEVVKPGKVLILSVEDDAPRVLRPRLLKCGANLSKGVIRFQKKFIPMNAGGLEGLEAEMSAYRPDLVIIDPLLTYMEGDMHRYNEATIFMADVEALAREYNACIVGIRHLTKAQNDDAMKRGIGSVGFAARARSVIQIGIDPDNESERALAHVKTNWGMYGKTLLFELQGGGRDDVPKLVWTRTADYGPEALNRPKDVGRPSEQKEIQDFLLDRLKLGPAKIYSLMRMAEASGFTISKRAMQRALDKIAEPQGKGSKTEWVLKKGIAPK